VLPLSLPIAIFNMHGNKNIAVFSHFLRAHTAPTLPSKVPPFIDWRLPTTLHGGVWQMTQNQDSSVLIFMEVLSLMTSNCFNCSQKYFIHIYPHKAIT